MATTLSRSESRNLYSWWWDSHISPKNSKWLKENLTDMDSKVKSMIKIIEVDQDTFAKRAEMYYKKRPELMKLVEEFYRAYRALAERYDHATGVIREAQTTMQEAFPNQVPFLMSDDEPVNSTHDSNPRTPEMQAPIRATSDLDELSKGAVGLSSSAYGNFTDGSDSLSSRKEPKNLNGVGKARKGLNFQEIENNQSQTQTQVLSESERLGKSESDIQSLKDSLAKLEAEKETGLLEYEKTLDRLSRLEYDFSQAKGDSQGLNERAIKAEAQVESLKEFLAKVETEREASLTQYQQCLSKIANLESQISRFEEDAGKAENEVIALMEELSHIKDEKEGLLTKYMEALEKLANLENKLLLAEDCASSAIEQAERAEKNVDSLRETITRLTEEKEVAVLKYEQSLEKIAALEHEIILIQKEAERLKAVVQDGILKMGETERENKSLQFELTEKHKEMGRLWTAVQEERLRFMDAEAGFEALQNLHLKVQDELRSVANELQKKVQLLKELENQKQQLEDENKNLDDLNLASGVSMESMREEILGLKDGKEKLEQELYCLKQELNGLSQKHQDLSRQVESVGFDPESIGSSVKELRDENSKLNESCQRSTTEISGLVERLGIMERLVQKNEILENSLCDLGAELEEAREKVKEVEESCQLLMGENGTLTSRLQMTTENLANLSQRNTLLENSVFEVNVELEMLKLKSKNLEDSCRVLSDENSALVTEKQALACELDLTHNRLVDLGKRHIDLEERYSNLEEERKSTLQKMEVLQIYLASEKQKHANSKQLSQTQMTVLEKQIEHLQEDGDHMREEFEEELDNAVNAQFEIFVLRKCIQDLKENNFSLLRYCDKLLEASRLSESVTHNDAAGMLQLLDTLEAVVEPSGDCYNNEDQRFIHLIRVKLDSIKKSLYGAWDENRELVDIIQQLKDDVSDLNAVIYTFKEQVGSRNVDVCLQQKETQKLLESNEELILKVREGNMREAILLTEVENLREKLLNSQMAYNDLQNENLKVIEEVSELDNLAFIFKTVISEKSKNVIALTQAIEKLCCDNDILAERVRNVERNLEDAQTQNTNSENELEDVIITNDHLKDEILKLQRKHEESEARVRLLSSELQKGKNEVILWETVAGTFFSELQSSSVREALMKEKFAELIKAYEVLEDESYTKGIDIEKLREKVEGLEGENSEINARLAADLSAIKSLKDSVTSLEKHAISLKKIHEVGNEVTLDFEDKQQMEFESQPGEFISLYEVQTRIQDVEKSLIELKKQSDEEYSGVRFDLDSALHQIKALKTQGRRLSRHVRSHSGEELLMKDIVLDQASDHSPCGQNRKVMEANDRVLDMWETIDRSCNLIDLTRGKPKKSATPSESLVERELGVDEQLSSNRVCNPMLDDNKKKTLERLASDVQKLTNLQITVRDLKEKLEMSESSPSYKGKPAERDNAKEQIAESEQTILKLFEYSSKLMKNIENSPTSASSSMSLSFDGLPSVDTSYGSARWRKSMDQARRISEKIGRLQLEVQKVQFFLMKLQNSNKTGKSGTKVAERSTRVLLRDYLYGGSRTPRRRKKTVFCGCVQPATKGSE